jgi:hypothetical protein
VAGTKVFYPISGALSEALPPREQCAGFMATYQYAFTAAQILSPAVVALFAMSAWLPWLTLLVALFVASRLLRWLGGAIAPDTDLPRPMPNFEAQPRPAPTP